MENYYTKIPSDLLEALIKIPLNEYEHKIFWLIFRKTASFKKQNDWISYKQIIDYTGIKKKPNICRTLKSLISKNMITKNKKLLGIQTDFSKWLSLEKNDIEVINERKEKVISTDNKENEKLSNQITEVISTDNKELSLQIMPSTDNIITDKTITDNNINSRDDTSIDSLKKKIEEIICYLNTAADKNFRSNSKNTIKSIKARLNEGFTLEDFKKVINVKVANWKRDPKMNAYLRPETLFGTKFESYLNEKIIKGGEYGQSIKHFENERDYTEEDRRKIIENFYAE